jgi:hypothetical protein
VRIAAPHAPGLTNAAKSVIIPLGKQSAFGEWSLTLLRLTPESEASKVGRLLQTDKMG